MLAGHQFDSGKLLEHLEPLVSHQRALALVLVHTQPRLGVQCQVGLHVSLLEIGELALSVLAESGRATFVRIAKLGEHLVTRLFHLTHPLMFRGQNRLGGG